MDKTFSRSGPVPLVLLILGFFACGEKPGTTEVKYVHVTAKRGLNLRARATIKSKRIGALPYGTTAPVIERKSGTELLQGRRGFWIRTRYKGKRGWIFSGFVLFADSKKKLEKEKKKRPSKTANLMPAKVEIVNRSEPVPWKFDTQLTQEFRLGRFRFNAIEYVHTAESRRTHCMQWLSGVKILGAASGLLELHSRKVMRTFPSLPGTLVLREYYSGCSCRLTSRDELYFDTQAGLRRIQLLDYMVSRAKCNDDSSRSYADTRYHRGKAVLIHHWRFPRCKILKSGEERQFGWAREQYTIIRNIGRGNPEAETVAELSSELRNLWNQSRKVTIREESTY